MSEIQIILLALWAGLAGVQHRFLGVIHIDRPLVAGLVVGLVTGDVGTAVMAGASLELIFIGAQRIGGSVPPNIVIGGTLGAAAAVTTGQGIEAAIAVGVPAALIGSALEVFVKTICSFFVHAAEGYAAEDPPNVTGITVMAHLGNLLYVLETMIPVGLFLQFGTGPTTDVLNAIPADLLTGLKVMGVILPVIGFAILLNMLLTRRMVPFFLIGFFLAAYLKVPTLGIAIVGLVAAWLYFEFGGSVEEAEATGEELAAEPAAQERRLVTRGDLRQLFWRNFGLQSAFSFERMQTHGLVWVLIPLLKKLYTTPSDLRLALQRHLTFFNTEPAFGGSVIVGMTAALEEQRAMGKPIDDAAINGVKVGLMGPLAGIGDSLLQGTWRIVTTGIGIGLAQDGNALGPIAFLVLYNIGNFGIRWYGLQAGYRFGDRMVELMRGLQLRRWMEAGSILGLVVVAGLIPIYIGTTTPIEYSVGGQAHKLQETLDAVLPAMIPLALTFGSLWLLRRGWNSLWVMLLLAVIGVAGGVVGLLA